MNEPDTIFMSFAVFEDMNPTLAKKFRLAGWTGPIRIELGGKAYGHAPFIQKQSYARLNWDTNELPSIESRTYYTDLNGKEWAVDEKGRVPVHVI